MHSAGLQRFSSPCGSLPYSLTIYPIRFADPEPLSRPVIGPILAFASKQGRKALQRMAHETGGAYYEVTESRSIEQIYAEIEDALRSQYSIGYTPARAESDGKYHKTN